VPKTKGNEDVFAATGNMALTLDPHTEPTATPDHLALEGISPQAVASAPPPRGAPTAPIPPPRDAASASTGGLCG
jgi:hypothetical protein